MPSLLLCILLLAVAFTSNNVVTSIGSYDLQAMNLKINIVKSLLKNQSCPIGSGANSQRKRSLTLPEIHYNMKLSLNCTINLWIYWQSVAKQSSPLKAQPDKQLLEVEQINHRTSSERHPKQFGRFKDYTSTSGYIYSGHFYIRKKILEQRLGTFCSIMAYLKYSSCAIQRAFQFTCGSYPNLFCKI